MSDLGELSEMFGGRRADALADPGMDEQSQKLLSAIKAEDELASAFFDSEIASAQAEATRRYLGEPYGDEVEGRSAVVSREVYETIAWLIPDLRRTFASGQTIVELDAQNEQDDEYAEDAADYLNLIFFKESQGAKTISDFAFDGLLHKVGFIGAYYREGSWGPPEEIGGLNQMQATEVIEDPTVELLEAPEIEQRPPDEAHPDGVFIALRFRRQEEGRFESVVRPPEDMVISSRAADIDSARSVGCDIRIMVTDLIEQFPEQRELILERAPMAEHDRFDDERRHERFGDEANYDDDSTASPLTREVTLKERYIRYDFDEDGHAERRAVFVLGDVILANDEVDEHPYSCWCPHPISHKLFGLSEHDILKDIEKVKTVVTRAGNDALYQALTPRVLADATTVNLSDLLTPRAGGVIRNDGPIDTALREVATIDVSATAIAANQYWDLIAERRSGVMRRAQPFDPDAIHDTAKGQRLIDNAASVQKEERAFQLKIGLEHHFGKLYRLVCANLQQAKQMRIKGREVVIDPRHWRKSAGVSVKSGLGAGARDERLAYLGWVQTQQEKLLGALGGDNPIVLPRKVYNAIEEGCRIIGYDDAGQFFDEPPPDWKPQPQPSPEMAKVQAEAEAKKAELQMKVQAEAADAQREQQKMAANAQLEQAKLAMEAQAKERQLQMEIELKSRQLAAELDLKWKMFLAELAMKERIADKQIEAGVAAGSGGKANGSGGSQRVTVGGDPG